MFKVFHLATLTTGKRVFLQGVSMELKPARATWKEKKTKVARKVRENPESEEPLLCGIEMRECVAA